MVQERIEQDQARASSSGHSLQDFAAASLSEFLEQNRLAQYYQPLVALGAVSPADLSDLTDDDYEDLGMRKLEKKRLILAVADLQGNGRPAPLAPHSTAATPAAAPPSPRHDVITAVHQEYSRSPPLAAQKAAAASRSTPPQAEEWRVDPEDGNAYTRDEFIDAYGGTVEWDALAQHSPRMRSSPIAAGLDTFEDHDIDSLPVGGGGGGGGDFGGVDSSPPPPEMAEHGPPPVLVQCHMCDRRFNEKALARSDRNLPPSVLPLRRQRFASSVVLIASCDCIGMSRSAKRSTPSARHSTHRLCAPLASRRITTASRLTHAAGKRGPRARKPRKPMLSERRRRQRRSRSGKRSQRSSGRQ